MRGRRFALPSWNSLATALRNFRNVFSAKTLNGRCERNQPVQATRRLSRIEAESALDRLARSATKEAT